MTVVLDEALSNQAGIILVLDGHSLKIENVASAARHRQPVQLHSDAAARIDKCRDLLERKIRAGEIMYGVNTGIGELAEVVLTPEQVEKFQRYLLYSHAAGCGEPCKEEDVRAGMLSRLNTHCWGHSGIRREVVEIQIEMLNRGVTPVVCQKGSVGACGDLSPMAQMAITLMGEGEVFYKGSRLPAKEGLAAAGISPITFRERDGLATINGSDLTTGMGCLEVYDAERWLKTQEVSLAMTLEALNANMVAYDPRIHTVRGYPGAEACAENVRRLTAGSELLKRPGKKVQDAYSLRSSPQVIGAAKDAFQWSRYMLEIELNHAADNPVFFPDEDLVLTGANFQGTPLAFALELVGMSVTTVAALSERRLNRLMNPHLSMGLPAFPHQRRRNVLGPHAHAVHRRSVGLREPCTESPGGDRLDSSRRRPGGLCLHEHDYGDQDAADYGERMARGCDRTDGGCSSLRSAGAGQTLAGLGGGVRGCPRLCEEAR